MADEFGAEIPIGPFAPIGDDAIGRGIVETLAGHRSPAVLMRNHGAFTIGKDARTAVKAAVMCEDVARSVHISRQLGESLPIPQAATASTTATRTPMASPAGTRTPRPASSTWMASAARAARQTKRSTPPMIPRTRDVWFVTGSQTMYGEETLRQVAEQSQVISRELADGPDIAVNVVWKPVLTDAAAIRRLCLEASSDDNCAGLIAWMHTFSPAKIWIAGLEALGKPLLHLHTGQRAAAMGHDRHGLHEPEPGRARRPRVRLHPDQAR
jgi:hypothetical protein